MAGAADEKFWEVGLLIGDQRPRIEHMPAFTESTGDEAIELAAMAKLELDDWQQHVLRGALGEREDGRWAAREVGLMVSRQNGKGALLEARELAGLFLLEEPLIIHSAHQFDTAAEHFHRISQRILNTPSLKGRVAGVLRGHGNESITLKPNDDGVAPRIVFRTRTGSGGLGFTISLLVMDEAMIISDAMHQALVPAMSAQPNMQVWYTGSAVDEANPSHQGIPFARVREKGHAGADSVAWFEWSLDEKNPDLVGLTAEDEWAKANPGLNIRIGADYVREVELGSLSSRGFAVQRLGVGAWPRTDGLEDAVILPEVWNKKTDIDSKMVGAVTFAADMNPMRSHVSISVAGRREDGRFHVELVETRHGAKGLVDRMRELTKSHDSTAVPLDRGGPLKSHIKDFEDGEVPLEIIEAGEYAGACGSFYDAVDQDQLRHLGQPELLDAIRGSVKRSLGEAWAWDRKKASVDITPIVSGTLAFYGAQRLAQLGNPTCWDLSKLV